MPATSTAVVAPVSSVVPGAAGVPVVPAVTTTTVSSVPVTRYQGPPPLPPARWSWPAFAIGLVVGILLVILLLWLAFITRTLVFRFTPQAFPTCGATDYLNDPQEAVRLGGLEEDHLFVSEGILLYRRKQANTRCVPGADQVISIPQPPICSFTDGENQDFTGHLIANTDGQYRVPTGAGDMTIKAKRHCRPQATDSSPFVTGRPLPLVSLPDD